MIALVAGMVATSKHDRHATDDSQTMHCAAPELGP
jgi:hypothetical protein